MNELKNNLLHANQVIKDNHLFNSKFKELMDNKPKFMDI